MSDESTGIEHPGAPHDTIGAVDAAVGQPEQEETGESGRPVVRAVLWLVLSLGFAAFIVLGKVSTHLGVEAVPWDKQGREYVWRVWWRSRHQIVDLGPAWGSALLLEVLALAFVVLSVAAVWIALVPDERAGDNELPHAR